MATRMEMGGLGEAGGREAAVEAAGMEDRRQWGSGQVPGTVLFWVDMQGSQDRACWAMQLYAMFTCNLRHWFFCI